MVAQPEPVGDPERLVGDLDGAGDGHVLLGVATGEHLLGIEVGALVALGFLSGKINDLFNKTGNTLANAT